MPEVDKYLPMSDAPEEIPVSSATILLGVSRQALSKMPKGNRGHLLLEPVVTRYFADSSALATRLARMRSEATRLGLGASSQLAPASSGVPTGHEVLDDNPLRTPATDMGGRISRAQVAEAVAQTEVDRLKSEVRRANGTIDVLKGAIDTFQRLVETARPAEDTGLDQILP